MPDLYTTEQQLFLEKNRYLSESFEEVSPLEFYLELYGGISGYLEQRGNLENRNPNAIFSTGYKKTEEQIAEIEAKEKTEAIEDEKLRAAGKKTPYRKRRKRMWVKNTIAFEGLDEFKEILEEDNPYMLWTVASPVTYSGRNRTYNNAYHLWGFVIDLDGVGMDQLRDLLYQIDNDVLPRPTYIVNSGHGMHVYFTFEEPIPLYPRLIDSLKALKKELTNVVWNKYTSTIPTSERQYQGLVQGYRAVGTRTKLGDEFKVTAFRTGKPGTLRSLQEWAETERDIDFDEFKHVTVDQAKELWPEWYQHRVVEGKGRKEFDFPRAVYDSWLKKIELGAFDGNRYNCIAVLFSLANRCGVEFEEVMETALEKVPRLNRLTTKKDNQFTEDDVLDAAGYYSDEFRNLGLDAVYAMTKIYIEPAKRNRRRQKEHLQADYWKNEKGRPIANLCKQNRELTLKFMREAGQIKGRPKGSTSRNSKYQRQVQEWRRNNPGGKKIDCERETGLSRHTVLKWWNSEVE